MPCGWEGNRRSWSGHASQTLMVLHLRAGRGRWTPTYAVLWSMVDFMLFYLFVFCCSAQCRWKWRQDWHSVDADVCGTGVIVGEVETCRHWERVSGPWPWQCHCWQPTVSTVVRQRRVDTSWRTSRHGLTLPRCTLPTVFKLFSQTVHADSTCL